MGHHLSLPPSGIACPPHLRPPPPHFYPPRTTTPPPRPPPPQPCFMPHLPHGQDQECEQQQAAQHAYQHPPHWNLSLLRDPKQLRLHLRGDPRVSSVNGTLAFPRDSDLRAGDLRPSHLLVPPLRSRQSRLGRDSGKTNGRPAGPFLPPPFHTHQSFPAGQAEGRHGVGKGGDVEPSVRLQHKLIQGPLYGVEVKGVYPRPLGCRSPGLGLGCTGDPPDLVLSTPN